MIRKIHKNNRNKTDTCLEGWGVGDTHFTGSHIEGIHISLGICVRGYTYHYDTDTEIACAAWRFCRAGRRSGVAERVAAKFKLLPPQSPRGFSALARLYYLVRPTKTAMLRRLTPRAIAAIWRQWVLEISHARLFLKIVKISFCRKFYDVNSGCTGKKCSIISESLQFLRFWLGTNRATVAR